jgi:hypothetical protein
VQIDAQQQHHGGDDRHAAAQSGESAEEACRHGDEAGESH